MPNIEFDFWTFIRNEQINDADVDDSQKREVRPMASEMRAQRDFAVGVSEACFT